jgi:hypothetical protein
MIEVCTDPTFESQITDGVIWEGETYYLDLAEFTEAERQRLIDQARLVPFARFDRRNRVCSFRIDGFVGTINVGGHRLDVRSRKLSVDRPGDEQFATLLSEIDEIRAGLVFHYASPTRREAAETAGQQPSALERLDFFAPRMVGPSPALSILGAVRRILAKPHQIVRTARADEPIERARRVDVPSYVRTFGRCQLAVIQPGHAASSPGAVVGATGEAFLPRRVPTRPPYLCRDTAENRFVRFFLEDIETVCLQVLRDSRSPGQGLDDAKAVLAGARSLLTDPFFASVGRLHHLPSYSPVLVTEEAYSVLYEIYLKSRLSSIDPLSSARYQQRSSPLKDVASLYEVWVFFKLADAFFACGAPITVSSRQHQGLSYGTVWRSGGVAVAYNRTFAPPAGSYSVTLRPDVTVQIGDNLWLFDAKYKADRATRLDDDEQELVTATVKKLDLQKMHTYVDAIAGALASFAVYPGTDASFFPKCRAASTPLDAVSRYGGVGGIPLLPSCAAAQLGEVVAAVRAAA